MEAFIEDAAFDFGQMGLASNYDPSTNSFGASSSNLLGNPVREVQQKKIPARDQDGNLRADKFDSFTGIIDGVTGEPLHGARHYSITGEMYEGKFKENGVRHGGDAIVKNICIPPQKDTVATDMMGELAGIESSHSNLSFERANFFGSYENDEPKYGTFVTDTFTYRGSFENSRFHGIKGELIHSDGYIYRGEFQEGFFSGMGRELDPATGEYQGEFKNGMKHGMGTFKEGLPETKEDIECDSRSPSSPDIQDPVISAMDNEMKANGFGNKDWGDFAQEEWNPDDVMDLVDKALEPSGDTDDEDDELRDESQFATQDPPERYVYSGLFHCNQRQGEGTEWTPGGEIFSGQYVANRRHGHGSLKIMSTGVIHEGQWRAGDPIDGNGWRILYPSGDIYSGYVKNLQPHGYGIYRHASGEIYSGDWSNGRRHGSGINSDPNGTEFTGQWQNDQEVSRKRLEETDGTLREIAETLRITDEDEEKSDGPEGPDDKNETQLSILKQAMAKSIETSLHIITSKADEATQDFPRSTPEASRNRIHRRPSNDEASGDSEKSKAELHSYANGDTYLGVLDPFTFQRQGYGVYVSKLTGCSYTGEFKDNKRHGFGILIHAQFGKYAGEFKNDQKEGEGTLILSDASSYHGKFVKGVFEGRGTLCERDGNVYVGEWRGGLRHGDGMETMSDGKVYKGMYKKGKREGRGTLLEKSAGKIIYKGPWRDGKYHGEGILIDRTKIPSTNQTVVVRWEGEFQDGKKHGYGVLTNESNNTEWKGMWSNGAPIGGKWRVKYPDGGLYVGQARVLDEYGVNSTDKIVAVPDGFGTFQYANGDVYAGDFEFGVRNGVGTCKFSSGEQWEGAWTNDHLDKNGSGALTMVDGKIHTFKGANGVVNASTITNRED